MGWRDKVLWREGAFLTAQHFQQQDRHLADQLHARVSPLRPHPWGIVDVSISRDLVASGRFAVNAASGVMPDGTPFAIGQDGEAPVPLDIPDGTRDVIVCLALPVQQDGNHEVASEGDLAGSLRSRYALRSFKAMDTHSDGTVDADLDVGHLRLRYVLSNGDLAGLTTLGLARIVEVQSDRRVVFDEGYIASCLQISASTVLSNLVKELVGLLGQRADALAARLGQPSARGVAEVTDVLMLQTLNCWQPLLSHWSSAGLVHPEALYAALVQMAGELATYTSPSRRATLFPPYRHEDLTRSFAPLMANLRHALSLEISTNAVPLPLLQRKYGVRVCSLPDRTLLRSSQFVLAVRADMPGEQLRRLVPDAVKIGAVEQISELVNHRLPGIAVLALPVAPRQIPFHMGAAYFELDRGSPHWQEMKNSGGFGIHFSGDFPNLHVELWAIRR